MPNHNRHPLLALHQPAAPPLHPPLPPPPLAKCGGGPVGTPKSKALRLAGRLVCVAAELLRLADEAKGDSTTRKLILALLDRVEQIAQQIRRKLGLAAREG